MDERLWVDVAIITPFYYGGDYLERDLDNALENANHMRRNGQLEVILVNDSPDYDLQKQVDDWMANAPQSQGSELKITVINNDTNMGIHASRVRGLEATQARFVTFLDQDDLLFQDAIHSMLAELERLYDCDIRDTDVLVCNARLKQRERTDLWFRTDYHKRQIGNLNTYIDVGTQIISPGQCLIRREHIPEAWKTNILKKNGSDDYYLWILMLHQGSAFRYLDRPLYTHVFTEKNVSADTRRTDESALEFVDYLLADPSFPRHKALELRRMIRYKAKFREEGWGGKCICSFGNLKILWKNFQYKKKTQTPLGFNRDGNVEKEQDTADQGALK